MAFNICSELGFSTLALIAITCSLIGVKGATIVNDRCPHSKMEMHAVGRSSVRWLCWIRSYVCGRLQWFAGVWCDTGPRACPRAHARSPRTGTIHVSSGRDFCARALWSICHQFKGVWIWTADREQVGISMSNATIHRRHCDWHKKTRALHETRSCLLRFT